MDGETDFSSRFQPRADIVDEVKPSNSATQDHELLSVDHWKPDVDET